MKIVMMIDQSIQFGMDFAAIVDRPVVECALRSSKTRTVRGLPTGSQF